MSDALQLVLRQSVEEVLEKMFFIRSLGGGGDESAISGRELSASVTFEGQPSGSLILRVAGDAARSISADFLGTDESELSEQQVGEVICELANMICGSVLSRVESAVTFRLAHPKLIEDDTHSDPDALYCVEIGGANLTVTMSTEKPVCSAAKSEC